MHVILRLKVTPSQQFRFMIMALEVQLLDILLFHCEGIVVLNLQVEITSVVDSLLRA